MKAQVSDRMREGARWSGGEKRHNDWMLDEKCCRQGEKSDKPSQIKKNCSKFVLGSNREKLIHWTQHLLFDVAGVYETSTLIEGIFLGIAKCARVCRLTVTGDGEQILRFESGDGTKRGSSFRMMSLAHIHTQQQHQQQLSIFALFGQLK